METFKEDRIRIVTTIISSVIIKLT